MARVHKSSNAVATKPHCPLTSGRKRRKGPSGRSIPALLSADPHASSSAGRGGNRSNLAQPSAAAAGADGEAPASQGGPASLDSRPAARLRGSRKGVREAAAQPGPVSDSEDALQPPQAQQVQQAVSLSAACDGQQPASSGPGGDAGSREAASAGAAAQPLWQRARAAQQPGWGTRRRAEHQMQQVMLATIGQCAVGAARLSKVKAFDKRTTLTGTLVLSWAHVVCMHLTCAGLASAICH